MNSREPQLSIRSFTFIELLVIVAITAILVGLLLPVLARGRERAHEIACLSNLKNISLGLEMYLTEYGKYPKGNLATTLASYVRNPLCLSCPSSGQSYEEFYVFRGEKVPADKYIIGCPYHSNNNRGVNAFSYGTVHIGKLGRVTWNDIPVNVGDEVTGGVLEFGDGSSINLTGQATVSVVTSLRMNDGCLYSIIRVYKSHSAQKLRSNVNQGSIFEVITPAAIASAKGTDFKVQTLPPQGDMYRTKVTVYEGIVEMRGRSNQVYTLVAGDNQQIEEDEADVPDDP